MRFSTQRRFRHVGVVPNEIADFYIQRDIESHNKISMWDRIETTHFNYLLLSTDILKAVA